MDPQDSIKDETLMAVLMLSLYERITAVAEDSNISGSHDAGAVALIKHRGKKLNTRSKVATTLFNAVHSQIVEHALDEPVAIGNDLADCLALADGVPQTAASKLNLVCTGLIDLRRSAKLILGDSRLQGQILHLVSDAFKVNQQLVDWVESVPPQWHKVAAKSFEIPQDIPQETFMYEDMVDVYLDLPVSQVWNLYRATRLRVLIIIVECFAALHVPSNGPLGSKKQEVLQDIQDITDDICASIPYYLGTKMVPGTYDDPRVEYPYINTKPSQDHRRSAVVLGGYTLIEPYAGPLKVAIEAPCTREGQREWLMMQLTRVGDLYNIGATVTRIKESICPVSAAPASRAATPVVKTRHLIADSRDH